MKLFLYEDYKEFFPEEAGRELTDRFIARSLKELGLGCNEIMRTAKGKPYIEPKSGEKTYISVSHSGRYLVCLVSDEPVGVDIQEMKRVDGEKVSRRYFTEKEQAFVDEKGREGFFFIWARKEAYAKLTGEGMAEIIKGTSVLERNDAEFIDFQLEKGIYCSCCKKI